MSRTQTGLMVTGAGPEPRDTSRWTRLKGAAFLTVVGAVWFYRSQRRPERPAPAPAPEPESASESESDRARDPEQAAPGG